MNILLPHKLFQGSVEVLDTRRLNNQANEALVILRTLRGYYGPGKGWPNHTVTKLWRGYEPAVAAYGVECLMRYACRTGNDVSDRTAKFNELSLNGWPLKVERPPWSLDTRVHSAYRALLLHKDYEFYSKYDWDEKPCASNFYKLPWYPELRTGVTVLS